MQVQGEQVPKGIMMAVKEVTLQENQDVIFAPNLKVMNQNLKAGPQSDNNHNDITIIMRIEFCFQIERNLGVIRQEIRKSPRQGILVIVKGFLSEETPDPIHVMVKNIHTRDEGA